MNVYCGDDDAIAEMGDFGKELQGSLHSRCLVEMTLLPAQVAPSVVQSGRFDGADTIY